jgi:hypothetical protein
MPFRRSPLAHPSGAVPLHAEDPTVKIRVLKPEEVEPVGNALGLARLYQGTGVYLVAWRGDEPAGHLHLRGSALRTAMERGP